MRTVSFQRLIQITIFAFFFYIVAFGMSSVTALNSLSRSVERWSQSSEIRVRLGQVYNILLEAESSQRGFLYTGRREYLISLADRKLDLDKNLEELRELIVNEAQERRLASLEPRMKQRMDTIEETIRLSNAGDTEKAREMVLSDFGRTLMLDISKELNLLFESERESIVQHQELNDRLVRNLQLFLVLGTLGFAILAVVVYHIKIRRLEPLHRLVDQSVQISQGNLSVNPLAIDVRDEIGIVSEAYNEMLKGLSKVFKRTREAENKIQLISASLARSSAEQASSSVQQSTAVQETAVTLEELSQSAAQIADRASKVGGESRVTSESGQRGLKTLEQSLKLAELARRGVEDVAATVVDLAQQAQDLEAIVVSVNELAERSNILAINASIQAAAAGPQGATFTVLADEMRLLANRSKDATIEVRQSLQDIRNGIHKAVMLAEEAVKRSESGESNNRTTEDGIRDLVASVKKSDDAFQQIVAATRQQSHAFNQVEEALVSIQETSQQAEKGSRDLEAQSQQLIDLSEQLHRSLARYELHTDEES